jgi:acyl-CoA synthetase (NDP forming)
LSRLEASPHHTATLADGFDLLAAHGFSVAPYRIATTQDQAREYAEILGYPVAVKILTASPVHKTEAGAVVLNVETPHALDQVIKTLQDRPAYQKGGLGFLIQKMIRGGTEMILGARRDPVFGPVILVGMGGIFAELLQDTSVGIAPLTLTDAEDMLDELKGRHLLEGFRGRPPLDRVALVQALLRLSTLMVDFPSIRQVDINPVMLFEEGKGLQAVDVRIDLAVS